MLLPLKAKQLGRDVTKSVLSKTLRIGHKISERGMLPGLVTSRQRAQTASLFGVHRVI